MRGLDANGLTEPRDVPDSHASAVVEVDDLRGLPKPQHVQGEHVMVCRQRGGQMIQAGIKNKYGFDMQVSGVDMGSSSRDIA